MLVQEQDSWIIMSYISSSLCIRLLQGSFIPSCCAQRGKDSVVRILHDSLARMQGPSVMKTSLYQSANWMLRYATLLHYFHLYSSPDHEIISPSRMPMESVRRGRLAWMTLP